MRILYISDITSIHTIRWVRYMVKRNHEVVVLSVRPGEVKGAKVKYIDPGDKPAPKWFRILRHLWFILNEWYMIKTGRYDIVHVHFLRADLTGYIATYHPHSVITTWGSDVKPVSIGGNPNHIEIRKSALERASIVTVVNSYLEEITRELAPDIKRTEVIPFGVDLSQFSNRYWKAGKDEETRFCYAKWLLAPHYGPDIAIKALGQVVEYYPETKLIMLGNGDEAYIDELKQMVMKLKLQKNVMFTGQIKSDDLVKIFERTDVLLQPSRWESYGVVILEAAAVGIPTIATQVGGAADLTLDGITGLTVPPDNAEALADAMITLVNDVEYRNELGRNAYDLVSKLYDFKVHSESMETLYKDLIDKKFS
ncbi:MAG: glycosyltransferase family 4 protein [Candidatus Hatepunaea meridiana]|nr:glycosyltransferase family 4 protein [Candidatus Hatepunaea meridiana]